MELDKISFKMIKLLLGIVNGECYSFQMATVQNALRLNAPHLKHTYFLCIRRTAWKPVKTQTFTSYKRRVTFLGFLSVVVSPRLRHKSNRLRKVQVVTRYVSTTTTEPRNWTSTLLSLAVIYCRSRLTITTSRTIDLPTCDTPRSTRPVIPEGATCCGNFRKFIESWLLCLPRSPLVINGSSRLINYGNEKVRGGRRQVARCQSIPHPTPFIWVGVQHTFT